MTVSEAVKQRRTVRAFENRPVDREVLLSICDDARLYACSANLQPIRFKVVSDKAESDAIFPLIRLAGYIHGYALEEKEQPPAYILVATEDTNPKNWQFEAGAVCTSIMLLAKEKGLETCCIGNFDKAKTAELLGVDTSRYSLLYLIAIGPSSQQNSICPVTEGIKYTYENGTFTVPKYDLFEILL